MAAILDIVGSFLLGGAILMIMLTASNIAAENQSTYHGDMMVQEIMRTTAQMVEGEFRNMGFGVPEDTPTVLFADSTHITFLIALAHNGTGSDPIDTVQYYVGNTDELLSTSNELDRYLIRRVNTRPATRVGVVTTFRLRYFARSGELLPVPVSLDRRSEVYVVEVTLEVQNPNAVLRSDGVIAPGERTALYSSSLWQQARLASQNSRR
jgi:hypothetical protein